MKSWLPKVVALFAPPLILALPSAALATDRVAPPRFVAGLAPYQRPAGMPVVRKFAPDPVWRHRSLTGVAKPVPVSLGFLKHQGAWYTPFTHAGMPGYYDLRQWHQGAGESDKAQR